MSSLFKRYSAYTTDPVTGELTHQRNGDHSVFFTFPDSVPEKKVKAAIAAKLSRNPDAVFIKSAGYEELN